MSEQEQQHGANEEHESVEEAVFKYVGVDLQGGKHEEEAVDEEEPAKDKDDDKNESKNSERGNADMEWFLRHDLASDQDQTSGGVDASSHSVAAAAVAAAFAANDNDTKKRDRSELNAGGKNTKEYGNGKTKRSKLQLSAVDPELASLDDSEVTEHEQLVRKAIMDADSIAHHPDFQHYLNTDEDSDGKDKMSKKFKYRGTRKHDGVPEGAFSDEDAQEDRSLHKKIEVLPKVLAAGSSEQDISHLIQDAATKASNFISPQSQSTGKSFDASEEQALEHFIKDYQAIKNLSRRQICERIWSNERRKDDFWTNICKVLPYRTRSSIYKHVRRKYHIFEQRGKWTPEEDQELASLCVEKEGQWSEIGKALGRMPEDCRDRWRNYVKCGNNRASNKWSLEEEERLKQVIAEIMEASAVDATSNDDPQADTSGKPGDDDAERFRIILGASDPDQITKLNKKKKGTGSKDSINWTVVSERMGGSRSRIQCRYKWNKLLKKKAMNKIKSITEDDKRWILEKLRDMGFTEDSQVDWDELATLMPDQQWSGTELKLCYEKLRTGVRFYKDRTINQICKELIGYREGALPIDTEGKP